MNRKPKPRLLPGERICPRCAGSGHWVEKDQLCFRCQGAGKIADDRNAVTSQHHGNQED